MRSLYTLLYIWVLSEWIPLRSMARRRVRRLRSYCATRFNWYRIWLEPVTLDAGRQLAVLVRLHIRKWHPGYWLYVLRALWPVRVTVRITIGDRRS